MPTFVADSPGLDPTLPDVVLKLGDVEHQLCFDFNSIVLAGKATGIDLLKAIASDVTAEHLRGLLWASLLKRHPSLTIEQAGDMITPLNLGTIHSAIIAAWFGSATDPDAKDDQRDPKQQAQAPEA
jgi:hypothetical protein